MIDFQMLKEWSKQLPFICAGAVAIPAAAQADKAAEPSRMAVIHVCLWQPAGRALF